MLGELIVAGVVGVMLFFTVAVAPGIFKVLPQQWASVYVRNFFPKYYAVLGAACLIDRSAGRAELGGLAADLLEVEKVQAAVEHPGEQQADDQSEGEAAALLRSHVVGISSSEGVSRSMRSGALTPSTASAFSGPCRVGPVWLAPAIDSAVCPPADPPNTPTRSATSWPLNLGSCSARSIA